MLSIPQNETMGQKQRRFVRMLGWLIEWAYSHGYELSEGEGYRTPEQAALNAQKGIGIANSLHCDRLAHDFNVFRAGALLSDGKLFSDLGAFWKSLAPDAAWGGEFQDGGHFSLMHGGRK